MALQDAGVKLIADGAQAFLSDMGKATGAVTNFGETGGAASKILGGLGDVIGNVAKVAAGAAVAGFGALSVATIAAVKAASDMNETYNKVGAIFGEAQAEILAFSETAASSLGQSKQSALDAASTFGVFGQAAGLAGADLTTFSVDLVTLASDLASFYNTSPEQAITALGAAMRGETEPMRAYGVLLDDFTLRTKAMEMGITDSIKNALTPQQKVLAANAVIMEQTAVAQGDFARTSDGLANAQRIITAELANLSVVWGTAFLPVVQAGAAFFVTTLIPALSDIVETLGQFAGTLLNGNINEAFSMLGAKMYEVFGPEVAIWVAGLGEQFRSVMTWFQTNIPIALGVLGTVWTTTLQPALMGMWQFLSVDIPNAAVFLMARWGELSRSIGDAYDQYVAPAVEQFQEWLGEKLPAAGSTLTDFWTNTLQPALSAVWGWILNSLIPTLGQLAGWFISNLPDAIDTLVSFWDGTLMPALSSAWDWIQAYLLPIFQTMYDRMSANLPTAIQILTDVWNNVLYPALTIVGEWIVGTLLPIFVDVVEWLLTKIPLAITETERIWTEILWPALQDVWDWIDKNLVPGLEALKRMFQDDMPAAIDIVKGYWVDTLLPALTQVWAYITNYLMPIFNDVKTWLSETLKTAIENATGFIEDLKNGWGNVTDAIGDVVEGIKTFIEWIKKAWDSIPEGLRPGSPPPFAYGMWYIADATDDATQSMSNFAGALSDVGKAGNPFAGFSGDGLGGLLGGLSSAGSAFGGLFAKQTLSPLSDQLKAIDEALKIARSEKAAIEAGGTGADMYQYMQLLSAITQMESERAALAAEYADQQERALKQQQAQEKLSFLQDQFKLLETIQKYGLNPDDVLGGITLGAGADPGALMDAMTNALGLASGVLEDQLLAFYEFLQNGNGIATTPNNGNATLSTPAQIVNNNSTVTYNISFTGNYASMPIVTDQADLAYILGLAS